MQVDPEDKGHRTTVPTRWLILVLLLAGLLFLFGAAYLEAQKLPTLPSIGYEFAVGVGIALLVTAIAEVVIFARRKPDETIRTVSSRRFSEIELEMLRSPSRRVVHFPGWNFLLMGVEDSPAEDREARDRANQRIWELAEKSATDGRFAFLTSYNPTATRSEVSDRSKRTSPTNLERVMDERIATVLAWSNRSANKASQFQLRVPDSAVESDSGFRFLVVDDDCFMWTNPADPHGGYSVIVGKGQPDLAAALVRQFRTLRRDPINDAYADVSKKLAYNSALFEAVKSHHRVVPAQ